MEKGKENSFICLFFAIVFCFAAIEAKAELVSWYRFEENADDSAGSNHGTVYGDLGWTEGKVGDALQFDGVGDYVDLGNDASLKPLLSVSLCAWIKLSALDVVQQIIHLNAAQTEPYAGTNLAVMPDNYIKISYGDGMGTGPSHRRSKYGTSILQSDTWYHIVGVIRGPEDMDIYIDGIDDEGTYSGTGGPLAYTTAPATVGSITEVHSNLYGIIDEAAIWNHALSSDEVTDIYINGVPEPATIALFAVGSIILLRKRHS
ncbi:MAG: PEP-CTERM sorting domain-containing protein [Sedimentisphaerales bacterium]|nr:PEP-CTERM sorting domain-containing protein [Sedimentisphaerales bacterium]